MNPGYLPLYPFLLAYSQQLQLYFIQDVKMQHVNTMAAIGGLQLAFPGFLPAKLPEKYLP